MLNESLLSKGDANTTYSLLPLGRSHGISADCNDVDRRSRALVAIDDYGLGFVRIERQAVRCEPLFN